jgi:nucleoside-diphosphate-sugar epimerase
MKKILITGTTGFIGKNLLDYFLKKKYFIFSLLRKSRKNIRFAKEYKINKNFKSIIFSNIDNLKKQLLNYKIDYVIHAATHYVKNHKSSDIKKIIESNVLFPTIIADLLCKKKIKKFINFGTVWQHYNNKMDYAYNLYASSKQAFNNIFNYYKNQFSKTKFYNLLISDTFGTNDKRKKLIPIILKNYNNKNTTNIPKNLSVNLVNVKYIVKVIEIIIDKNIKPNTYVIKEEKNLKIFDLINYLNQKLKVKIKINWIKNKITNEKIINFKTINFNKKNNTKKEILELFDENLQY